MLLSEAPELNAQGMELAQKSEIPFIEPDADDALSVVDAVDLVAAYYATIRDDPTSHEFDVAMAGVRGRQIVEGFEDLMETLSTGVLPALYDSIRIDRVLLAHMIARGMGLKEETFSRIRELATCPDVTSYSILHRSFSRSPDKQQSSEEVISIMAGRCEEWWGEEKRSAHRDAASNPLWMELNQLSRDGKYLDMDLVYSFLFDAYDQGRLLLGRLPVEDGYYVTVGLLI